MLQRMAGNEAVSSLLGSGTITVQREIETFLSGSSPTLKLKAGAATFGANKSLGRGAYKPLLQIGTVTPGVSLHVHLEAVRPIEMAKLSGWNFKNIREDTYVYSARTNISPPTPLDEEDKGLFNQFAPGWATASSYKDIVWGSPPREEVERVAREKRLAQDAELARQRQAKRDEFVNKKRENPDAWIGRQAGNDTPRKQRVTLSVFPPRKGTVNQWKPKVEAAVGKLAMPEGVVATASVPTGKGKAPSIDIQYPTFADYRRLKAEVWTAVEDVASAIERDEWEQWAATQTLAFEDYLAAVGRGDHDRDIRALDKL